MKITKNECRLDGQYQQLVIDGNRNDMKIRLAWANSNYRKTGSAFFIIEREGAVARACFMGQTYEECFPLFEKLADKSEPLTQWKWVPEQEHFRSWHYNPKTGESFTDIYNGTSHEEMEAMLNG